jgi:poly(3-hydroxybutyrate) depolymerase
VTRRTPSHQLLALLLLVCGVAAFASTRGVVPAVAGVPPAGVAVQAAAVSPAVELDPPALVRTGTNADGWAVYRLEAGRIPDRLPVGNGFRGEITWLQGGLARKARLYVPRSAPATAALLVSLHGLRFSLRGVEAQQRWSTLAFQQELVVVWAAGHRGSWNAGPCCGAAAGRVDDLAYLDRLLQITGALQGIDRRRVHLAGYSNGAMLAYRYACGRPGRIAGVLAVAGTHIAPCTPTRATAVLAVHGADDPTVPLPGTRYSAELRSPLPPVARAPQLWARTGAGVRSVVLPSYAHGWPTRHDGGYDATGEGWRFLKAHPLP